jgi:hypothetical protein
MESLKQACKPCKNWETLENFKGIVLWDLNPIFYTSKVTIGEMENTHRILKIWFVISFGYWVWYTSFMITSSTIGDCRMVVECEIGIKIPGIQ